MDAEPGTRERLERDLARNQAELAQLERDHLSLIEASRSSTADDEHDPEGATIAFEREQLASIMTRVRRTVTDLRQAITDLDAGGYGLCDRCGRPIGSARLEIRPQARLCIECARLKR
jgi:RNA polymerase-binding protein DksA